MTKKSLILFHALLLMLPLSSICASKGGIKGLVLEKDSNPVDGAKITITSVEYPSTNFTLKTNKKGEFIQIGLEPGWYQVLCEKEGFAPRSEQVRVPINEIVDTTLKLNPIQEQIDVKQVPGKQESQRASQLFLEGKYEEALDKYQAAVEANPEEVTNHYNLGITYMALNLNDKAIEAFKKTIELDPDNFLALKFLGQLYSKTNNYQEAENYFSHATRLSEKDPELFYNLGVMRINTANYSAAIEAFQKAIACDVDYIDAYYQLGLLYINQNQPDEATSVFEIFLKISPEDPRAPNVKKIMEMIKK
jgi:tetratricopeptide (TPR) repeat protein